MNSSIKHIACCITIVMGLLLISCGPSVGEKEAMSDSVARSFEIMNLEEDSLSVKNIKAFEYRAIQKLEDLKDYFEILSNPEIDIEFKDQAREMAMQLFASNENTITLRLSENQKDTLLKADLFFVSLQNGNYGKLFFEIHNASIIKNIEKLGETEYQGAIEFKLYILAKQGNTKKMQNEIRMQCEIIAKKVKKDFGKESKKVWEVFLGNIFQVN